MTSRLKSGEVGKDTDEDIACGVLGLFPVAESVKTEAQDRVEIAIIEGVECRVVALGGQDEQRVGVSRRRPLVHW